jgi:CRISPR/Cas system-associated endoribonuclease Cas2
MPDVGDVNLVRINRIKDEITKTRRNDNANVRFVRFSSRERIVAELTRVLDKTARQNVKRPSDYPD